MVYKSSNIQGWAHSQYSDELDPKVLEKKVSWKIDILTTNSC